MLNHIEFKPSDREELFKPLDQVTDDLFDDAVECAKEVYLCYMNDDKNNFNLFAYLDKLASVDRGFTYNFSTDTDGKMTGFCWMTSTMRYNFERFHCCVFLNAMRCKTNFHLWPYISIVIVNELGESQPVIEGFFTSEIDQAYIILVQSALQMAPNVDPKIIQAVFADQYFTQDIIISFGLIIAKLFYNHYHLRLNQEKALGQFLFGRAKSLLSSLLLANDHEDFLIIADNILERCPDSLEIKDIILRYKEMEVMIAAYVIDQTMFSLMRRGSTPSEQNHSSVVSYIGRDFCGELIDILALLLQRHQHKNKKTNE